MSSTAAQPAQLADAQSALETAKLKLAVSHGVVAEDFRPHAKESVQPLRIKRSDRPGTWFGICLGL